MYRKVVKRWETPCRRNSGMHFHLTSKAHKMHQRSISGIKIPFFCDSPFQWPGPHLLWYTPSLYLNPLTLASPPRCVRHLDFLLDEILDKPLPKITLAGMLRYFVIGHFSVNSFSTRLLSSYTDEYAHTCNISTY